MYALITGASSGIGLELAKIAAEKKYDLLLIARNSQKLNQLKEEWESLYSIKVLPFPCDLSQTNAVDSIADFIRENRLEIDVLINNAGFGLFGGFHETDMDSETSMIHVNVQALTQLTKIVYKQMVGRKKGRILNIASMAAFMPGPLMSVYYASKAYVLSFSQALANEAKEKGVSVTALCPGPTSSNFEENAQLTASMMFQRFGKIPDAKSVAEYGFRMMEKGKTVTIYGFLNKFLIFLVRFFPRKWLTGIVRYIQKPS